MSISVCLSLSVCLPTGLPVYLPVRLCPYVRLFVCLADCLRVCMYASLSNCLSACLSAHLFFFPLCLSLRLYSLYGATDDWGQGSSVFLIQSKCQPANLSAMKYSTT